jgi:hypothetical protein
LIQKIINFINKQFIFNNELSYIIHFEILLSLLNFFLELLILGLGLNLFNLILITSLQEHVKISFIRIYKSRFDLILFSLETSFMIISKYLIFISCLLLIENLYFLIVLLLLLNNIVRLCFYCVKLMIHNFEHALECFHSFFFAYFLKLAIII